MRQHIEKQIATLMSGYERTKKAKTVAEHEAIDAEARKIMTEMAVDGIMLFHGINEHLGRIAIALEKLSGSQPPAQSLFRQP